MSEDDVGREAPIPVTLIKDYFFCPRIIYFTQVLGYTQRTTEYMIEGKEEDERQERLSKRRRTATPTYRVGTKNRWRKLQVSSDRLGLYGTIDEVVETDNGLAVMERKHAGLSSRYRKPTPDHLYQAVAYAMLAQEALGRPVTEVIIHYTMSNRTVRVTVTPRMKRAVLRAVRRIRAIIDSESPPPYKPKPQCSGCTYRQVCLKA